MDMLHALSIGALIIALALALYSYARLLDRLEAKAQAHAPLLELEKMHDTMARLRGRGNIIHATPARRWGD